ncbi:translation initiation factor IF-3 [Candidatus Falkowbacteria bacterium HGW-Falkowbacteria-1]|uniref:Translation initiation factor IF-3 n=1 Tax=Candidatus Falkowbacteria bacterium HGW-Falkowbacteria-1 TaxID=2013768 RepID=A0A2N2EAA9_9BACT|nr:MAG: translation initiation factor IF-3 [Candidatus Falkowbacteria bacterium HGW-Falkowbacteria-1]
MRPCQGRETGSIPVTRSLFSIKINFHKKMRRKFRFPKVDKRQNEKQFNANEKIRAEKVFLINEDGENVGVMETYKALQIAQEAGFDLVEVNPKAEIPVVKILDLGQFKYEQDKKRHKQKVLQKKVEIKNIKVSLRISGHDFDVRVEQAVKFLTKGNKVKIDLNLRGREKQHFDKAREVISDFLLRLKSNGDLSIEEEQVLTKQPGGYTMILANKAK